MSVPDHQAPAPMESAVRPRNRWGAVFGIAFLVSIALLIALGIVLAILPDGTAERVPAFPVIGVILGAIAVLSIPGLIVLSRQENNRIRRFAERTGWSAVADPTEATAVVRMVTSRSNEIVSLDPRFPGELLLDAAISRPLGVARAAVPPSFSKGKNKSQISWTTIWVRLPRRLPSLILMRDVAVLRNLAGDIDIENEQFNRTYQVGQWKAADVADRRTLSDAEFARYAVGVLHPRAAEILLAPAPQRLMLGIRGDVMFAWTIRDEEVIEKTADVMLGLAASIPRTTYDDFGR